jgi:hypothetical protein
MEWLPTPYIMDVFSSRTGEWEERSFARNERPLEQSLNAMHVDRTKALPTGMDHSMLTVSMILF